MAFEYALFTLELLLSRHLAVEASRLADLVRKARARGWSEVARQCDALRKVRNYQAHPSHDSYGGIAFVPGIRGVFEVANEVANLAPVSEG
jgi:hypothetical protein